MSDAAGMTGCPVCHVVRLSPRLSAALKDAEAPSTSRNGAIPVSVTLSSLPNVGLSQRCLIVVSMLSHTCPMYVSFMSHTCLTRVSLMSQRGAADSENAENRTDVYGGNPRRAAALAAYGICERFVVRQKKTAVRKKNLRKSKR